MTIELKYTHQTIGNMELKIKDQESEIKALRVKVESLRVNLDKALNALDVKG